MTSASSASRRAGDEQYTLGLDLLLSGLERR
jgi:hypothetical protein